MNNFLKTCVLCCFPWVVCAQKTASCCALPVAQGMAQFASDEVFLRAHASPLPFCFDSANGEMIRFYTPDDMTGNGYLLRSPKPSDKWLLVYQEWWGLNDYIKKQAEAYWRDLGDVNVLAVDMYDGKVTDNRDEAGKLMSGTDPERLEAIMQGAIFYVGPKAKIVNVGWCFGGGLSLQSAILGAKHTRGSVMYYGMPEKDVAKLKTLNSDVLCFIATRDKWITPQVGQDFVKNMAAAGKKVTVVEYDAEHAFANPSNPNHDATLSADAYGRSLKYMKKRLKKR